MPSYNPNQLTKAARALFMAQFAAESNLVDRIATRVDSSFSSEDYAWIGHAPQMEEFVDEVKFDNMTDATYSLANKTYTSGIGIKRSDIEDEQTGGIALRIRQLAQVAARHPNKLLIQALIDGTTNTGFDGVAMFSASHAQRGKMSANNLSNLLSGAGTTTANVMTDLNAALSALLNFELENGDPANETLGRIFIVAPPLMRKAFKEALGADIVSNTSNVQVDGLAVELILNARLSSDSTNDWYLGVQDDVMRGLIFQDRVALEFTAKDRADDDAAFTREEYLYKTRYRGRAGYGHWQKLIKVNNA